MRSRVLRAVDVAIVILLVAVFWRLAAPATRRLFLSQAPPKVVQLGERFEIPDVELPKAEQTIVVALSEYCWACAASVPLLQELSRRTGEHAATSIVAIAPASEPDVDDWLERNAVGVDQIVHVPRLADLGIIATPTVLLLDAAGRVELGVVGTLGDDDSAKLLARAFLGWSELESNLPSVVGPQDLPGLVDATRRGVLVDLRQRDDFASSGYSTAWNIPADELAARAPIELPVDGPIVLLCEGTAASQCALSGVTLKSMGFTSVYVLHATSE